MKKIGITSLAVMGLLLTIWAGISTQQHFKRQAEIKAKLEEAIGRDAGYTETILKMESESNNITYGEFFDLCNKSVDERTNLIVELRGLYPSVSNVIKDRLIDFLNAENDTVRSKRDMYRRHMLLSSAMESATETLRDRPTSEYGWDFYRERLARSKEDLEKSANDLLTSGKAFVDSYEKTLKVEGSVADATKRAGIHFKTAFSDYDQSNVQKAKESIDLATQLFKQTT
jgi:hypothetical protein